ncbi:MAG: nuclear transport factor 2 family protein [Paucibacter sp.]|nr:nuclear transport factor 2 family protein [Roseateles sp.]
MIKRSFLAVAAFALCASLPALADSKAELIKLEQKMLDGVLAGDMSLFEKTVAPGFVFTTPDGKLQTAADLVADMKSGKFKLLASKNENMEVHLHGSTAVVVYSSVDKGTFDGQPFEGSNRWTDVFVKQGKAWKLVVSHGTPLPSK